MPITSSRYKNSIENKHHIRQKDEKLRYTLTPFANTFRILVLAAWQTSNVVSICFTGIFPYRSEDR